MKKFLSIIILINIFIIIILYINNNNYINKIYVLEQNNKALLEKDINNNSVIYEQNIRIEELERIKPELEHQIDSISKLGKITVEKVDVVTIHDVDSVFIPIEGKSSLDTVINEKCMDIFLAYDQKDISLVIEQKGSLTFVHTSEKELVNQSKSKIINFFKKIFGKSQYYNKMRIVDECGILENVETYNIYE